MLMVDIFVMRVHHITAIVHRKHYLQRREGELWRKSLWRYDALIIIKTVQTHTQT